MLLTFLLLKEEDHKAICSRPFMDLNQLLDAVEIDLYSDAMANENLGCGGIFRHKFWYFTKWESNFILKQKPSIEFLELYAVCLGIFIWTNYLRDLRIVVH